MHSRKGDKGKHFPLGQTLAQHRQRWPKNYDLSQLTQVPRDECSGEISRTEIPDTDLIWVVTYMYPIFSGHYVKTI